MRKEKFMDKILFSNRLTELRKARGFRSQGELAKAYNERFPTKRRDDAAGNEGNFNGILGTIKNYENPNKDINPNLNIVCNLCEILNCDIDYLIGKIDVPRRETADVMTVTGMSQKSVENIFFMRNYDYNALIGLCALLETYIPKELTPLTGPDRKSPAGLILGYITMPQASGKMALAPDGTAVINVSNGENLLPPDYAAILITLSDASRVVMHEKLANALDQLRMENGGKHYSQTRNQDLEGFIAQQEYNQIREKLLRQYPELDKTQELTNLSNGRQLDGKHSREKK